MDPNNSKEATIHRPSLDEESIDDLVACIELVDEDAAETKKKKKAKKGKSCAKVQKKEKAGSGKVLSSSS